MNHRLQRWFFKLALVLFAVEVALSLVAQLLRSVRAVHLIVLSTGLSLIAYVIRKRGRPEQTASRSISVGERKPVMPRNYQ
jgi:hypothetical protein